MSKATFVKISSSVLFYKTAASLAKCQNSIEFYGAINNRFVSQLRDISFSGKSSNVIDMHLTTLLHKRSLRRKILAKNVTISEVNYLMKSEKCVLRYQRDSIDEWVRIAFAKSSADQGPNKQNAFLQTSKKVRRFASLLNSSVRLKMCEFLEKSNNVICQR